jgi:hypothetical protein
MLYHMNIKIQNDFWHTKGCFEKLSETLHASLCNIYIKIPRGVILKMFSEIVYMPSEGLGEMFETEIRH